jgi:probable F420-dependent oxidoreductase
VAGLQVGFIPIEGGHYYRDALEEVVRAEELGFDSVWMEEHHSVTDHYWPSPLPVLAGFATRTQRMRLGTDILVAPFYHPVRLAEDTTMLDVISGGRFVLGIAIGYKPDEFALYGAELEKRGARFEEQLAIMRALWTQESVAFDGTYYTVEGRLEPKPITRPHPPVWIGGWGDITLRRAATLADNWVPGPTADLPRLLAGKQQFLANRRAAAHPGRDHRRHRPGGARAGRETHHDLVPEGVRGRLAASLHRRLHRHRSRRPHEEPLPHRRAGPDHPRAQALRHRIRDDPPDLPGLLPRHAPPAHHARARAPRERGPPRLRLIGRAGRPARLV